MPDFIAIAQGKVSKTALTAVVCCAGIASAAQGSNSDTGSADRDPAAAVTAASMTEDLGRDAAELHDYRWYRKAYERAMGNRQFGEAENAAKQMIAWLIESGGGGRNSMATALSRLALAQVRRERYESALLNYGAAIRILESTENRLSETLIEPLRGIGDTYMASGHAALALPVYRRALHVRHVNDGPHTLKQVRLLDTMIAAEMQSGDTESALDITDRIYALYAREFAVDSEEVLPALERKAELLNDIGLHDRERMVYRKIVEIIEDSRGASDLSLLEPYTAMAHTYFYDLDDVVFRSEPTTDTGESFLQKALDIAVENPEAIGSMQEQALVELGDYYTVRDAQGEARSHYRRAWDLMSSDESDLDRRRQTFGGVVPLIQQELDPHANFGYRSSDENADPEDYRQGYIVARFTINDRGRVNDIEIADSNPPGFTAMEVRVHEAVEDFVYRPRYDNGMPVDTPGELFRHDFLYLESDLEAE